MSLEVEMMHRSGLLVVRKGFVSVTRDVNWCLILQRIRDDYERRRSSYLRNGLLIDILWVNRLEFTVRCPSKPSKNRFPGKKQRIPKGQTQRLLVSRELSHHVSSPDFVHSQRQDRQMHLIAGMSGKKCRILTANLIDKASIVTLSSKWSLAVVANELFGWTLSQLEYD